MKKFLLASILLASLFSFSSCDKNDDAPSITTTAVNTTVSSGTWRITYYWDTDHEETSNFNGFNFTFASGNVVSAANGILNINGTWSTGVDDSKVKLILAFTSNANFIEISDDWEVTERTDTRVKLRDISGGGGGTDYLTFEKN
jgi:hypothetical protein